jgi:hypothetical protein
MRPLPHRYDVALTGGPAGTPRCPWPECRISALPRPSTSMGRATRGAPSTCYWLPWRRAFCSRCVQWPSLAYRVHIARRVSRGDCRSPRRRDALHRHRPPTSAAAASRRREGQGAASHGKERKGMPGHRLAVRSRAPGAGNLDWLRRPGWHEGAAACGTRPNGHLEPSSWACFCPRRRSGPRPMTLWWPSPPTSETVASTQKHDEGGGGRSQEVPDEDDPPVAGQGAR